MKRLTILVSLGALVVLSGDVKAGWDPTPRTFVIASQSIPGIPLIPIFDSAFNVIGFDNAEYIYEADMRTRLREGVLSGRSRTGRAMGFLYSTANMPARESFNPTVPQTFSSSGVVYSFDDDLGSTIEAGGGGGFTFPDLTPAGPVLRGGSVLTITHATGAFDGMRGTVVVNFVVSLTTFTVDERHLFRLE